MQVKLPAVLAINYKTRVGFVRQISAPKATIHAHTAEYTLGRSAGYICRDATGATLLYVFKTRPKAMLLPSDAPVLFAKDAVVTDDVLDVTDGIWLANPVTRIDAAPVGSRANTVRASWRGAFQFAEEDPNQAVVGLRKPQVGALHAIHAHWSISSECATVVMPTGTGKTETMLAVLTSTQCERVLVVVPTDALRSQLAAKFETLGLLKMPGNAVLADSALRPVVGILTSKPKTPEEVNDLFTECNVIVTTSHLVGTSGLTIQQRMAELCSHLFVDEAHHAEANTWKAFRERFSGRQVLQFTATPFREDGQAVDGKLVYVYPLRKAQQERYFRPIRFRAVREFNAANGDRKIAIAALDELDADTTGKHIVMARVASTLRAAAILTLYQSLARYEAVAIHSGMSSKDQQAAKRKLFDGSARVVVCVDMLGEGFDLPELKIAAFHDIRKSLSVTLQLAGRFTRARDDLGDPVFIANIALVDVRDELRKLYSQEPDWNALLPALSTAAIEAEQISQDFFSGFGIFLDAVPINDLRPAASMVVYKTSCANWFPKRFKRGMRGLTSRDNVFHTLNEVENTLVVLTATEQSVRWSDVESIRETAWELFIAVWDRERGLLYLHGSGLNGEYKEIAKALCGHDVELVVAPEIFRVFHGIKRLILNNVGLNEHLGRQVRYTGRMGSDVESRIGQAARRGAKRALVSGSGFEGGEMKSVGAAKRGRVWSNLRLRVDSFAVWARSIGAKIADETIDPDTVLAGTLKPRLIGAVPSTVAIAVDWPKEVLERPESVCRFFGPGITEEPSTNVDIALAEQTPGKSLLIRVFCERWESVLRLELISVEEAFDFRFVHVSGVVLDIGLGTKVEPLAKFFTETPPIIWFADGSALEGCEYTELPADDLRPYNPQRLQVADWSDVDIRAESQGEQRRAGTIQHKVIQVLLQDASYDIVFDDDGANEAADIVAIRLDQNNPNAFRIEVELYHLKYAGGAPGRRLEDMYVVCGQAQRSASWLTNHLRRTELFTHLLRRNDQRLQRGAPTRFERGTDELLLQIREISRQSDVKLKVYVVQPGLSQAQASDGQLTLLAVTERFLSDTYEIPLHVICSA